MTDTNIFETNSRQTIQVWCHVCQTEGTGKLNTDTCEYNCSVCASECVEEISQGVETFNGTFTTSQVAPVPTRSEMSPAQRQDLATINSALQSGGRITHIARSTTSGRPVGVIIRHVTADVPIQSGSALRGLLNTLNNVASESSEEVAMARIMHHILMNERSHAGAPAASEDTLSKLSKHTVTDADILSELGECNITQESFEVGDVMVCLPCEHKYKEDSIVQWLKMHNTCPVCRVEVKTPLAVTDSSLEHSAVSVVATPDPTPSDTSASE